MSGLSSLETAVSGLNAAQAGLYVAGHNIANSDAAGYSRQRVIQSDSYVLNIGFSPNGTLQMGLGADIGQVQQLRDLFLDAQYRAEFCRMGFYEAKSQTGIEIESIIGETQSQYNFQSVIHDVWNSLNELAANLEGLDTRGSFIATCGAFAMKADDVYNRMLSCQRNLDSQIRNEVERVNELTSQIHKLNVLIASAEAGGDRANDFRDERNLCLDELSKIIPIEAKEKKNSRVDIVSEGKELLCNGSSYRLGLKFASGEYALVEPVFTESAEILPADARADEYKPLFEFAGTVDAAHGNDRGTLMGLMSSRGARPANYLGSEALSAPAPVSKPTPPVPGGYAGGESDPDYLDDLAKYDADYDAYQRNLTLQRNYSNDVFSANNFFIPKAMAQMDKIVNSIVTMLNDSVAPASQGVKDKAGGPWNLYSQQPFAEVFKRKGMDRWDGDDLIPVDEKNFYSQYTMGNITVNPELLRDGGFNLLALSPSGDREDNRLANQMIRAWTGKIVDFGDGELYSIDDAYNIFTTEVGTETAEDRLFLQEQGFLAEQLEKKRDFISGVSLDEQLRDMMIYQHAYSASARMLNAIDSMLERIINAMGRAGR
ncbi:MAG: flagellar hook-associated protein FlgK [Clostridiales bacterium]|jgi:flagellar hook-associated protein 1 FlgK|nr:flagellar hook-associated protein FlgK [Clostridiales bacterium]